MARRARVVVPSVPHHVTQRGTRRQPVQLAAFLHFPEQFSHSLLATPGRIFGQAIFARPVVSPGKQFLTLLFPAFARAVQDTGNLIAIGQEVCRQSIAGTDAQHIELLFYSLVEPLLPVPGQNLLSHHFPVLHNWKQLPNRTSGQIVRRKSETGIGHGQTHPSANIRLTKRLSSPSFEKRPTANRRPQSADRQRQEDRHIAEPDPEPAKRIATGEDALAMTDRAVSMPRRHRLTPARVAAGGPCGMAAIADRIR